MAKTISIKPEEQSARSYADRLILEQLTEMESAIKLGDLAERLSKAGLGLGAVRALLASNPDRFAYFERKWIPNSRVAGVGRPYAEAVRLIVDLFGGPMSIDAVVTEVARIRQEPVEAVGPRLRRILDSAKEFVVTPDGMVALSAWAFLGYDESSDRAFELYGVNSEDVEAAASKLAGIDWRASDAISKALAAAAPISAKTLAAVAWQALKPENPAGTLVFDGREFFAKLISVPGYVYGADGVVYPEAETKKWISTAVRLADKLAPTLDVEDAAPIDIKQADLDKAIKRIIAGETTVTATSLLEEFYEITVGNKTYPDDLANLVGALQAEKAVWWVGADRFRKPESAPEFVYSVPELFQYAPSPFLDPEGDPIDVEVNDDGLSSSLRKLLSHPLATDVLDEDAMPRPKQIPEKIRLVLKSIHRELGTFPLCQIPTGFLDEQPSVQELIFMDPNGKELQVWANTEARLLYNLIDWWFEQPVESGAVFTLAKTEKPNVFEFAWEDQTDPLLYISSQRMELLREIQSRSENMSTLDILVEVMHHWPKGADFLTLLAETNVVRRSTRRLVASLLSCYQCFYQRSGSPVWHFDNKKIELGFDKTKKKFIKK
ncbi:MAG: hypothetical protein HZC36_05060 [Armatimonadetes bacterium]|nr:hypothetical protein [Armatimonadota bacterium]